MEKVKNDYDNIIVGELSEEKNTCASYHFFTGYVPGWFNCIQNRHP